MNTDAKNSFRVMLQSGQFIVAPGVFDLVSAKIADRTSAQAIYMTGYGVVASYLGQPDAGLATYTDMVNRAEAIADAIDKPLIADGDTGYGGLLNVAHTVRGYEKAGVAVIQIEDQHFPTKSKVTTAGDRHEEAPVLAWRWMVAIRFRFMRWLVRG